MARPMRRPGSFRWIAPLCSQCPSGRNITVASKERFNRYSIPDTLFYKYRYRVRDIWLGWNLGTEKFLRNTTVRDRRFLGVRILTIIFTRCRYRSGINLISALMIARASLDVHLFPSGFLQDELYLWLRHHGRRAGRL